MPENDYVLYPLGFLQSPLKDPGEAPRQGREASLTGANLSKAILIGANLSKTWFRQADLSQAKLASADLTESNLERADLRWANLRGVNLEATLSLKDTDLRGVKGLTEEQLEACKAKGAIIDEDSTTSPPQPTVSASPSMRGLDAQIQSAPSAQTKGFAILPPGDKDKRAQ